MSATFGGRGGFLGGTNLAGTGSGSYLVRTQNVTGAGQQLTHNGANLLVLTSDATYSISNDPIIQPGLYDGQILWLRNNNAFGSGLNINMVDEDSNAGSGIHASVVTVSLTPQDTTCFMWSAAGYWIQCVAVQSI